MTKQTKKYWLVNTSGQVSSAPVKGRKAPGRKKFGNYFRTKKMAEECRVRMIKLFKRIKNI